MSWLPDLTLIDEEALLRELEELNRALQAKQNEWSTTVSFPQERIDPPYIAALITGLEIMGNHLATYLPRANELHDKNYTRASELLTRLSYALMAFQTNLHRWYRNALVEQTKEAVEKIRHGVYERSQDIQNGMNDRWRADFFRTCIRCQHWVGDNYPYLETCPSCGRFLHK